MSKSDYDWDIIKHAGQTALSIIDLDRGRRSVTNDIENVVEEIEKELKQRNEELPKLIVYRDSEGEWDAWDNEKQDFVLLLAKTNLNAIERLIRANEKKIDVDRS